MEAFKVQHLLVFSVLRLRRLQVESFSKAIAVLRAAAAAAAPPAPQDEVSVAEVTEVAHVRSKRRRGQSGSQSQAEAGSPAKWANLLVRTMLGAGGRPSYSPRPAFSEQARKGLATSTLLDLPELEICDRLAVKQPQREPVRALRHYVPLQNHAVQPAVPQ